jgi:hypothetical protein
MWAGEHLSAPVDEFSGMLTKWVIVTADISKIFRGNAALVKTLLKRRI